MPPQKPNQPLSPEGITDEDAVLRCLVEGVSKEVGREFFRALVKNLAQSLHTYCALVTEFNPNQRRAKALAFWMGQDWVDGYEYNIGGTPCENVFDKLDLFHYPDHLERLFPKDHDIPRMGFVSYMGVPLLDTDGSVIGNLAVMDRKPLPSEPRFISIFRLFASRAAAEHQRLKVEAAVQEREHKLSRLFEGAMDAIIELDAHLKIIQFNPAAEKTFGCTAPHTLGGNFMDLLHPQAAEPFKVLLNSLASRKEPGSAVWIAGGLNARRGDGSTFVAEATLARIDSSSGPYYTLILRNIEDRILAAHRIHTLKEETKQLREEINTLKGGNTMIGESPTFRQVIQKIDRVAPTNSSVLITGDTGTGKELIARAIHTASQRHDKPLICVNCAAIPANLIESEFFGHTRGAFTGATEKREGRFALADQGTLFLDELGELPLDLQGKLLRVLQEGAFEPVGSSQTRQVDVRLIAATNRKLDQEVASGKFREDLYYRLNVYPLHLPALRDRGQDVWLLAERFAQILSKSMGRPFLGLTDSCREQLKAYSWPGNVRELRNVIERALITSSSGYLDLKTALAGNSPSPIPPPLAPHESASIPSRILSEEEFREFERQNIQRALHQCQGTVSGPGGAAILLGIRPSTLSSRMKALGIK